MSRTKNEAEEPCLLPEGIMGPFKPVTQSEIDWFNSTLADEIDSSFASSIRCCDRCFDDFRTLWPGTVFRDIEFQCGSMSLELAIMQSRLPEFYSSAEIATLRHFVKCPRCNEDDPAWIWIHEHAAADNLEKEITNVGKVARRTPFLVLEDPFARQVLEEIRRLGAAATARPLPRLLYRARPKAQIRSDSAKPIYINEFGPPPAKVVQEGRFNHTGLPMLYLADSLNTTVAEIGMPGQTFYVAALEIIGEYRILDLTLKYLKEAECELLSALAASALIAAPRTGDGWIKKEYIFTRFLADCAVSSGFDVILYGSTKLVTGSNYVLLDPPQNISTTATLNSVEVIVAY